MHRRDDEVQYYGVFLCHSDSGISYLEKSPCPFPTPVCKLKYGSDGNTTLTASKITHYGLGSQDIWILSRHKVSLNHRITCHPLDLGFFLMEDTDDGQAYI
jgi:hypothetical protein